jgi:phasin family protein
LTLGPKGSIKLTIVKNCATQYGDYDMVKNSFFENWLKPDLSKSLFPSIPNAPFGLKEMMESGRKSVQAYSEAQQIAAQSFQAMMQRQSEILSQLVQDQSAIAKEVMNEGTPEEKIARSAELIREAYEKTINNAREVGDIANKSAREALDVLNDRVTACFEEIQSTAEDAKEQKSKKSASGKKVA